MGSCRLCRGWHAFLQSPGKWAGVFSSRQICPDDWVPINGSNLSRHDKIVLVAMQKPWQQRVGQQPYWHCLGSRSSHGIEILISGNNFDRIDLWSWLRMCPGCWRQLPIPSVLAIVRNLNSVCNLSQIVSLKIPIDLRKLSRPEGIV